MTGAYALAYARTMITCNGNSMLDKSTPTPTERPYSPGNKRAQLASARRRLADTIRLGRIDNEAALAARA
jgi:hypothetical protein